MLSSDLFRPGENCWRVENARRLAIIIETADYFEALREACEQARYSILVVGWDFDRREKLGRADDAPSFEDFFCGLLEERPDLHIHLLLWDFNIVYAGERELFQGYRLRNQTHERLHVHFDAEHPTGGSHHQKIVVIDDALAFSGGIDLSRWRWDTADHAPDDERRIDPDGKRYPPFHDAMMLVDGPAASALADLVRERWRQSGSEMQIPQAVKTDCDPWPDSVEPAFTRQAVAIARTMPRHHGRDEVREVERLFLDSIDQARDCIYIENQYFTSQSITDALARRLGEEDPPDILIVLPHHTGGWLEQFTMDVIRKRRVQALIESDRHGRLRVFEAYQPGLDKDECISVHAKLMLADDRFLRVGSANTSDRSMGLDTECDLALVQAGGEGVTGILHRLLAEHLDCDAADIRAARKKHRSLAAAVDELCKPEGRSLRKLDVSEASPDLDLAQESDLVDPGEPVDAEYLMRRVLPGGRREQHRWRLQLFIGLILLLLVLAASWRFTPLSEWLDTERLASTLTWFEETWIRFLSVCIAIVVASLLMMPISVLIVASALLLGPWLGFLCSMAGGLVSGGIAFLIGQALGGRIIERYSDTMVHRVSEKLSERGVLAMATIRLVPVAPFTVVNLVAGASHIPLGNFMLGTLLGMLPGVAGLAWFSGSLLRAITEPGLRAFTVLGVVAAIIVLAAWFLRRMLRNS